MSCGFHIICGDVWKLKSTVERLEHIQTNIVRLEHYACYHTLFKNVKDYNAISMDSSAYPLLSFSVVKQEEQAEKVTAFLSIFSSMQKKLGDKRMHLDLDHSSISLKSSCQDTS